MPSHFFTIPVSNSQEDEHQLNAVLAAGRVLHVERHFVPDGANSFWAVCVDVLSGGQGKVDADNASGRTRRRIDYKEVLDEGDFAVFAQLREIRKKLAIESSVPTYTVFTNEQLAEMVRRRVTTRTELGKIAGIGPGRVEKYADAILAGLAKAREESG